MREHPQPPITRHSLRCDDEFLTEFSTLDLPKCFENMCCSVDICNGLVCYSDWECHTLLVCNPGIRRYVELPKPRNYTDRYFVSIGFGFDSETNDYKVVRISCKMEEFRWHGTRAPKVELYSLATGLWKSIAAVVVAPVCFVQGCASHAVIDGIVHWAANRKVEHGWYHFILSFDFRDEVFSEIMLPECLIHVPYGSIDVIGDLKSLTVYRRIFSPCPCSCSIWVMKEYGVVDSWNKMFTINWRENYLEAPLLGITLTGVTRPATVICCTNRGKVLLRLNKKGKQCIYSLDTERKRFTEINFEGDKYTSCEYFGDYAESLVLLDKAGSLMSY